MRVRNLLETAEDQRREPYSLQTNVICLLIMLFSYVILCVLFLFKLVRMKHNNDIMPLSLMNAFYMHATN